jgi:hypothetical protein
MPYSSVSGADSQNVSNQEVECLALEDLVNREERVGNSAYSEG